MKYVMPNNTLKKLVAALAGIGGISFIILLHEAGHFLCALFFKVPAPIFSVGFGPTLFSFTLGKTVFQIAMLPIGGYVEIDQNSLALQTYLVKMLIIFAGVLFNIMFAYGILLYYALHNYFSLLPIISSITPNSPAENAGLQKDDEIIAYDHQSIDNPETITKSIALSAGKTIMLTIKRNETNHKIPIQIAESHPLFGKNVGWIGIELEKKQTETSLLSSLHNIHRKIRTTTQNMYHTFSKTMTKKKDPRSIIIGPIGIISLIGKSLLLNPSYYFFILALLSLNMALFNLLPLPFFDGGKALLFTIEALFNTTVSPYIMWIISNAFLILLVLFITKVSMNDIKKLIGK